MTLTVRLPPRVEQELKAYCVTRRITKSDAVKEALERLLSDGASQATPYELGKHGFGADDSQSGEIARNTKRLIQERFRAKSRR
jgi:Arc/MetJ-type ribon-helix-helix transcriptional regulator